jgi:electron transfer flavoprotein alpha subunit
VRPIYAGNAICTVSTSDKIKLLTVRPTNFEKVPIDESKQNDAISENVEVDFSSVPGGKWVENIISTSESVDLSSAKFVVSGGRGMKNGENFKLLDDLAGSLGKSICAVGASRAAVDAGFVSNDLQIG